MEFYTETTPTALRSAFVAPTLGASAAGVCPQTGVLRADSHTQVNFPAVGDARLDTPLDMGHRPWSPLIT